MCFGVIHTSTPTQKDLKQLHPSTDLQGSRRFSFLFPHLDLCRVQKTNTPVDKREHLVNKPVPGSKGPFYDYRLCWSKKFPMLSSAPSFYDIPALHHAHRFHASQLGMKEASFSTLFLRLYLSVSVSLPPSRPSLPPSLSLSLLPSLSPLISISYTCLFPTPSYHPPPNSPRFPAQNGSFGGTLE